MTTKTVMTDAQEWLREYLESDNWRNAPRGVWSPRRFLEILTDHPCGDNGWCNPSNKAQTVNWDEWEEAVRGEGEELNPRLEYPTAPPPAHPQHETNEPA